MSLTVQTQIAKLYQRIDPQTKLGQTFQDNSGAFTITAATNATPIVVTAANHGLTTGYSAYITGIVGNTAANNTLANPSWIVTVVDANTFSLNGSIGNGAYVSGGTGVGALVGSVDGSVFKRQRILDIYNDARLTFIAISAEKYIDIKRAIDYSGLTVSITNLQFTAGLATKPSGYIDAIYLRDAAGADIAILGINNLPLVSPLESAANRFVFELANTLKTNSSNTYIPDAATYQLTYIGLSTFTITDVLNGTSLETFNDDFGPALLEIAQAIANEMGGKELNALAEIMIRKSLRATDAGTE